MNKTDFTPGPWGIERTDKNNWIGPLRPNGKTERIVVYNERGSEYIAEYRTEQDANAYLIAAAPELYEIAVMALELAESDGHDGQVEFIRKTLAKARGEDV